ncbi:hypothetical protein PM3016_4714 [Paenibacillus mucilaginosus 3016]|uniref:Lipoprotein n=1 Tax=Paenibacillus mucilaginosus 3016 TaxID=1116391 RepID=H6NG39_9BACL|nr:hypothetical protein [Paenibacillus mucilaginosus]AFC31458.1 hypothetical protein PM3016_4714 [Paenibacillus mucilaginosus 3016]
MKKQMISSFVLLAVLAAGCGTKPQAAQETAAQGAAAAASGTGQTSEAAAQTQTGTKPAMNDKTFSMSSTFRSLISLDKQEGLALTKEQAQQMLPLVQSAITASELTEENKTKLTGMLTDEQKQFVEQAAAQRPGGGGNRPADAAAAGGTAPQPQQDGTAPAAAGSAADAKAPADGAAKTDAAAGERPARGSGQGGQGMNGGRNAGQELVTLLQSKIGQ